MNFFKYFAFMAILVLCLTASSEAGLGKKLKKAASKVGHKLEHVGQNVVKALPKVAGAAVDVGKIAGTVAVVGSLAG